MQVIQKLESDNRDMPGNILSPFYRIKSRYEHLAEISSYICCIILTNIMIFNQILCPMDVIFKIFSSYLVQSVLLLWEWSNRIFFSLSESHDCSTGNFRKLNALSALKSDVCLCKCLVSANNWNILFYHWLCGKLLSENTVELNAYAFSISAFDKNSDIQTVCQQFLKAYNL